MDTRYLDPYNEVFYDLEELKKWLNKINVKMPKTTGIIRDEYYLEICCIQVLVISLLEFFFKEIKKPVNFRQNKIKEIIMKSSILKDLEKDWLLLLFYQRHCIVHNGARADSDFQNNLQTLKHLKYTYGNNTNMVLAPTELQSCINLIQKLMDEEWFKKYPLSKP